MSKKYDLKLSIIVPAFNEESSIGYALESALFQRTDFPFEVIVVDDGSTDQTLTVIKRYQAIFDNLVLIINELNLGKGSSFRKAYAAARGEYFHVLDADDYFVSFDKVQRQVEALDENPHVFAVAHNSVILHPDKTIEILNEQFSAIDYSYEDCVNFNFYHHTSSFMIRKLLDDLPEEFGTVRALRGDSACLYFHAFLSKQGVRFLPDLSSVYDFHGKGLWSKLEAMERNALIKELFEVLQAVVVRDEGSLEHALLQSKLDGVILGGGEGGALGQRLTLERILQTCLAVAGRIYQPDIYDRMFRGMHGLRLIDQLCEMVGRILMIRSGYSLVGRTFDGGKVAFLVTGLQPKGGGIFAEIADLIALHLGEGHKVLVVLSGMAETNIVQVRQVLSDSRIEFVLIQGESLVERVQKIIDVIHLAAPERLYPYVSHHDVVNCSAVQKGLAREIVLNYVYDHGSSLGLSNSSVDKVVFKSARQIDAVASVVPEGKRLLIPPMFKASFSSNPYRIRRGRPLVTACAAARSYKVEMDSPFKYCEVIAEVLHITGGRHVHFGPLSDAYVEQIGLELSARSVSSESFVHVPFAENFSDALNEACVDIFITPFPIPSARIGIEVMSCGIPMICYRPQVQAFMDALDFCDPGQWRWSSPDELYSIVSSVSAGERLCRSFSARQYFDAHHDFFKNSWRVRTLEGETIVVNKTPPFELEDIVEKGLYSVDELKEMISSSHSPWSA